MTDEKWKVVWKLFSELRELPVGERRTAVASASLTPELREELQALLEQSTFVSASGSLAPPPLPELNRFPAPNSAGM